MSAANKTLLACAVAAAALTTGAAACSLILDFDESERPCAPDSDDLDTVGDCLDGYSCLVKTCVKNGSIPEGETCWVNAHCEQGHVCATDPFACRERCDDLAFGNNSACPSDRACVRKTDSNDRPIAACVPNRCAADTECDLPGKPGTGVCVPVTPTVSVCELACDVDCSSGVCSGNCGLGDGKQLACQPIGMDRDLACIPEGTGQHGDSCDLVDQRCNSQSACMRAADGSSGTCMAYCDATAGATADCSSHADLVTGDDPADCTQVPYTSFGVCGNVPAELLQHDSGGGGGPGSGADPGAGDPDRDGT